MQMSMKEASQSRQVVVEFLSEVAGLTLGDLWIRGCVKYNVHRLRIIRVLVEF